MSKRTASTHKYAIAGKGMRDTLNQEEQELFDLCYLAGVEISPAVLRIILDLLKLNISPVAIVHMIKSMVHQNQKSGTSSMLTSVSASGSAATASAETTRGDTTEGSRGSSASQRPSSDRNRDREDRRSREQRPHRERDGRSSKPRGQKSAGRT